MQTLFLSVQDTAQALSLSRSSIYKLINAGTLHTIKIGTRTLVTMESIEALLGEAR